MRSERGGQRARSSAAFSQRPQYENNSRLSSWLRCGSYTTPRDQRLSSKEIPVGPFSQDPQCRPLSGRKAGEVTRARGGAGRGRGPCRTPRGPAEALVTPCAREACSPRRAHGRGGVGLLAAGLAGSEPSRLLGNRSRESAADAVPSPADRRPTCRKLASVLRVGSWIRGTELTIGTAGASQQNPRGRSGGRLPCACSRYRSSPWRHRGHRRSWLYRSPSSSGLGVACLR